LQDTIHLNHQKKALVAVAVVLAATKLMGVINSIYKGADKVLHP